MDEQKHFKIYMRTMLDKHFNLRKDLRDDDTVHLSATYLNWDRIDKFSEEIFENYLKPYLKKAEQNERQKLTEVPDDNMSPGALFDDKFRT